MIIVVDGYNVLKLKKETVLQKERDEYSNLLKRYAKKKHHTIILVFDGGITDWPYREKHGAVVVIYSGRKESADDVIKSYLKDNAHKDLLLITADRELINYAAQMNVEALAPMAFESYVKRTLKKIPSGSEFAQAQPQKLPYQEEKDEELDALMAEGSIMITRKDDDMQEKKNRQSRSLIFSKKDRKLVNKLKKL